jgi:hypothetical protein
MSSFPTILMGEHYILGMQRLSFGGLYQGGWGKSRASPCFGRVLALRSSHIFQPFKKLRKERGKSSCVDGKTKNCYGG